MIKGSIIGSSILKLQTKLIETAILPGPAGASYGPMYKMHKYWSKKPSETIAEYIDKNTNKGDVVLDPFSGYGVTAFEAVRLGRRAVAIDLNPMSTFINRVILEPVNLSLLNWAFKDVEDVCKANISDLFTTTCPACGNTKGDVDFVVRHDNEPLRIAYTCDCAKERLFKEPDKHDRDMDIAFESREVPFWYPERVPLPTTQKERFQYVDELFTRRNLIALSQILHAIEGLGNERVRNVMKLAFTAALDKCSRLKPLSGPVDGRPTLSLGWVAARFYAPPKWQEVNPWKAFDNSFKQCREGKRDSNKRLSGAVIGSRFEELESGAANVLVLQGSCENVIRDELPERSVDYVLTDPPYGAAIQYLTLSTFWGTWLRFHFDYEDEIVVDPRRHKSRDDYEERMRAVFHALGRTMKQGSHVHVFYNDIKGPYLHTMVNSLEEARIKPERILHQPPPNSFGVAVRARETRKGYYGSYVVGGQMTDEVDSPRTRFSDKELRQKLLKVALPVLQFHGGEVEVATILHTVYGQLNSDEISAFAKHDAQSFLLEALGASARLRNGIVRIAVDEEETALQHEKVAQEVGDALLAAGTLFVGEDSKNRVRHFVLDRFQQQGLTPEDIRQIEARITEPKIGGHHGEDGLRLFQNLLCHFGDALGFRTECGVNGDHTIIWRKENSLECCFELRGRGIRVFSLLPEPGTRHLSEWGTIPYDRMGRRIWEWCRDNSEKGQNLRALLKPLQGPSYDSLTLQVDESSQLAHLMLKVIKNEQICDRHMLMQVELPKVNLNIRPGQFFHLICDPGKSRERGLPLTLRRPFSAHGMQYPRFDRKLLARADEMPREIRYIIDRRPSAVDFMYKIVGDGTHSLANVQEGTVLDAIGPCGNLFRIGSESAAIVVAGGIGVAPLIALVEQLRYLGRKVYVYFGAHNWEFLKLAISRHDSSVPKGFANGSAGFLQYIQEDFAAIGINDIHVCTDESAVGLRRGNVTQLLDDHLRAGRLPQENVCIYACGPEPMLRSLYDLVKNYSLRCQVLLEQRMACGIGTCLSCVCDTIDSTGKTVTKRVCRDGPVFDLAEIKWKD